MAAENPVHPVEARGFSRVASGAKALVDVTFDVPAGSIAAVVGPSGSGKSLLLRAVGGRLGCDSGSIRVLGLDPLRDVRALATRVGYAPQYAAFPPRTTVGEVGRLCRRLAGDGDAHWFTRVCQELELLLGERADRLSEARGRHLSLALALQRSPELVIADEPDAFALAILEEIDATVFFATDRLDVAASHADQVLLLRCGHIVDRFVTAGFDLPRRTTALEEVPAALPMPAERRVPVEL
ncbi:MAG TPA: ATP-binding cassette domain-containing protein [Planctomycetota bacterium]|nr:ATP-binding cassette domain-containing protein [Planctomycetota bacterium]